MRTMLPTESALSIRAHMRIHEIFIRLINTSAGEGSGRYLFAGSMSGIAHAPDNRDLLTLCGVGFYPADVSYCIA
jgi:hypothetical protein